MQDCKNCIRARAKQEEHLAAEGYIECKATSDASLILQAFSTFAAHKKSSEPFEVAGVPGHPHCAWPFLFLPGSIESCAGFSPRVVDHGYSELGVAGSPE